ncbi:MAG: hypothetical protein H6856_03050 [Rhodospirillales bacterium]|nr:hypothetical protein [Rhodospirillales bacterium]
MNSTNFSGSSRLASTFLRADEKVQKTRKELISTNAPTAVQVRRKKSHKKEKKPRLFLTEREVAEALSSLIGEEYKFLRADQGSLDVMPLSCDIKVKTELLALTTHIRYRASSKQQIACWR